MQIQSKNIDIIQAYDRIAQLKSTLENKKDPNHFNDIFESSEKIYNTLCDSETVFRGVRLTMKLQLTSRKDFFYDLIEKIVEDMDSRLTKREFLAGKIYNLIPFQEICEDDIDELITFYFPLLGMDSVESAKSSLIHTKKWLENSLQSKDDLGDVSLTSLINKLEECPLRELFKVLLNTSVSNSSAERTFSKMKLVKTYLRNKLSTKNMSNQCIVGANAQIKPDVNRIFEKFVREDNLRNSFK